MLRATEKNGQTPGLAVGRWIDEAEFLELYGGPRCWRFTAGGGWSRARHPAPWQDGDSRGQYMRRGGFYEVDTFGTGRLTLALWENHRTGQYLAVVSLLDDGEDVLLPAWPDLLAFLAAVLPAVAASAALGPAEAAEQERLARSQERLARSRGRR